MSRPTALINVMEKAARRAATPLIRDYGEVEQLQVSRKGPGGFASEADRRTGSILRDELRKARPGFGFLPEESDAAAGGSESERWIVDPIDGTTNFLHGIPHFAISIAAEREGELVAGLVLEPLRNELFWAERGAGAYVNRRRMRTSERGSLSDAVLATGIPFGARPGRRSFAAMLRAAMERAAGIRRFGAASLDLAYVAAGRLEGFWEVGLPPRDVAAGIVLVREAGGMVSEIGGGPDMLHRRSILATSQRLHGDLRQLLNGALRDSGLGLAD